MEKESEKKALSKEDRLFLSQMKKCITFVDGHYVLPLPLRKQTGVSQESKVKVEPMKEDLRKKLPMPQIALIVRPKQLLIF